MEYIENSDHVIITVNMIPPSLNKIIGSRGRAMRGMVAKRQWVGYLTLLKHKFPIPKFKKCSIKLELTFKTNRNRDPDNYFKIISDALVRAGILSDDNYKLVEWLPVEFYTSKEEKTLIIIYPKE